jgi:HK97 family phage major capsid protein
MLSSASRCGKEFTQPFASARVRLRTSLVGTGVGNHVEGLYTQATGLLTGEAIPVERIGYAVTLMDNAGYSVDVIFLNPTDWLNISLSKDAQGRYLFGNPASPAPPVLFNRRVVASPAIPLGHALVGDTTQTNVLDRMEPTVFISRDHLDYRTRNLVLILVETRVGFELYDKAAFRKLDIVGSESESG